MTAASTTTKCACRDCTCSVDPQKALKQGGQLFCCQACADHHKSGEGCNHGHCKCHG